LATICTLVLAGCNRDNQAVSIAQPRGASVAFDSLDGLPPGQFRKLVQNLNDEAQTRRLAVISREQSSAYRVRGYLAVKVTKHQTTVSWVWDVFDQDEHRALRISGEETANVRYRDAWAAADDAMLSRIAHNSMERLATFLTSPEVAPPGASPPVGEPYVAMAVSQEFSAEAAGIFRVIQPLAVKYRPPQRRPSQTRYRSPAFNAPQADALRRAIGAGDPDDCGFKPLIADSSFRQ
jgi:hypothetical protein